MSIVTEAFALARQQIADTLFTSTCNVVLPTKGTADGRGGWAEGTPTTVYSGIPCNIQAQTSQNDVTEEVRQRLRGRALVTVKLKTDKVITMAHRIVRGTDTFEVIGTPVLTSNALTLTVPAARNTP